MSAAYINGKWACYGLPDGRHRHFFGCSHERPRQAIAHTVPSYTSPLRVSGSGSSRIPAPPVSVYDEPPPELRRQLPAVRTGRR